MESDNADGPSIKAAFPYTQRCFHVVCESSRLEFPQIPKKARISYSRLVLWCLPVFCIPCDSSSSSLQLYFTAPPFPLILVKTCTVHPSLFLARMSSASPLCTNLVEKSVWLFFGNKPFFVLLRLPVAYKSS